MTLLPASINRLAEAYEQLLFEGELRRRFSHHMAQVASERWLAMELAMLFNERAIEFGQPGWAAILEKGVIDVSLIPPDTNPRGRLPVEAIFLELKLIGAEYWRTIWAEVRSDLAGKTPKKLRADYAVCFLVNHLSHTVAKRRPMTDEAYKGLHARIPLKPAEFEPVAGMRLQLLRTSEEHRLEWPSPVSFRWPEGYDATVRILWITELGRGSKLDAKP
jgi:hypothetical protein